MNDQTQLSGLNVKEISLVGLGANGEKIEVFKSASGAPEAEGAQPPEADPKKEDEDEESEIEKAFKKALSPIVEKMATLEVALDSIAKAQMAQTAEQVSKSVAEQVVVEVAKAYELHKQLVDEKIAGIQAGVAALGDAIKAGANYDDLWAPFMHVSDALYKLHSDSMTLQMQGVGAEVAKSADKKAAIVAYAAALPGIVASVIAKSAETAATAKIAEVSKALEKVQADVAALVDAPAPPAGPSKIEKSAETEKPSAFTGMFGPGPAKKV